MIIKRDLYLNKLIAHKHNGRIKIITGIRRCGKSFLLSNLFKKHLLYEGVKLSNIIEISLDDIKYKELRNPEKCYKYVTDLIDENNKEKYYLLLDEVQLMTDFEDVLNGFLHLDNIDVYVTGSNSKFLSKDIATVFRGRGDEIRMFPLSFSEFYNSQNENFETAWEKYYTYGGLPYILTIDDEKEKIYYLKNLFEHTYLRDIVDRYNIKNDMNLSILVDIIASNIGSLTNPQKLSNTFKSEVKIDISMPTIKKYIDYLEEAFMVCGIKRYDIKGKKYINTPMKYYFEDIGLRNARLNFRQIEKTHIMENIIFNELRYRGYLVDIGMIKIDEKNSLGKYERKQIEIDFIANQGIQKYYIQSAFNLPTSEKEKQEKRPFLNIADSFKKIIIVKDNILIQKDDNGIITMGLKEFLLNPNSLELS
ncbi:ATP-binding protein [Oceanivirga salmonicida]|uniref:ATP-binding protein n=1 Tax=Oceanivirga salmonicida TaxID=1769291 RepID=UPI0008331A2C|nr:ATP-binding protein [Oceanivirga salmonicida]